MKKQTDIAKKQYQILGKAFDFDKKDGDKTINKDERKPTLKKYNKSDLILDSNHSFTRIILKNLMACLSNQGILFCPTFLMIQLI